MKKLLSLVMSLLLVAAIVVPAGAQTRYRQQRVYRDSYNQRYDYNGRYNQRYDYNGRNDRSFWEKHRDKITTGGGAVAGALLGGLLGGKKGAVVGALLGGGGAAVYTYKGRDRYRRY